LADKAFLCEKFKSYRQSLGRVHLLWSHLPELKVITGFYCSTWPLSSS